jgi:RecB family exonuclease
MNGRVITANSFAALEGAVRSSIVSTRKDDAFAPVDCLIGSNLLAVQLRRRLAGDLGGLFNIRFHTFVDLVDGLDPGAATGPLSAAARRLIASRLLSAGVPAYFHDVAGMKGFAPALLGTFDDLAEGGCTGELARRLARGRDDGASLGERARGVLQLFAGYRDEVERYGGDMHTRFAKVVEEADTSRLAGPLLIYGFYDFNEMQWRLIERLAADPGVVLFIPWCEEESHRFAAGTMARIERSGFTVEHIRPPRAGSEEPERYIFSAPGDEEEVAGVVRRIIEITGDRSVRFGDIGILLPAIDPYIELFTEALDGAGIPCRARARSAKRMRAPFTGARRLLGLLGDGMARRSLTEFLVSAPLAAGDDSDDPFSLWVRTSAEAGLAGADGWRSENRRLIDTIEAADADGEEIGRAAGAARAVGAILERLEAVRSTFSTDGTWHAYTRAFASLIEELFPASDDRDDLLAVIGELEELDRFSGRISFASFAPIVESVLHDAGAAGGGPGGGGINLMTIGQARGLSFKIVFIPGLIERVLPGVVRHDPFLRDEERVLLGRLSGGRVSLPARTARIEEEVLLFKLAVEAAEEILVCSYPRRDMATGKELIPSSFLRAVGDLAAEPVREKSVVAGGAGATAVPASEAEYDLIQAIGAREGGEAPAPNTFLDRGIALVRSRYGTARFTPFDGVFSSRPALDALASLLDESGWSFSPTSLESYAGCPFAYYLTGLLGLEELEEPGRTISITPLQRGIIVHSILARLFGAFRKRDLLPLRPAVRSAAVSLAGDIAGRCLDDYPKREPVGIAAFWEFERRTISASIVQLVEEECAEADGYLPSFFERSFGGADAVPFACADRTVRFHGRIDRIDCGGDTRYRVIDYKTGSLDGLKDQALGGGTTLQLPIYLYAVSILLDRPVSAGVAEYRRVGSGRGRRSVSYDGAAWERRSADLTGILDAITGGIARGLFFAVPSAVRCGYCTVRSACPSGAERIFERKAAGDERCRAYLEAREVE